MKTVQPASYLTCKISCLEPLNSEVISKATGFIGKKSGKYFLFTNKHVVTGKRPGSGFCLNKGGQIPAELRITLSVAKRTYQGLEESCPWSTTVHLYQRPKDYLDPLWHCNEKDQCIDVACIDVTANIKRLFALGYTDLFFDFNTLENIRLRAMQRVTVVGFPIDNEEILPNDFPIFKTAYIASEPELTYKHPYILIDGKQRKGCLVRQFMRTSLCTPLTGNYFLIKLN